LGRQSLSEPAQNGRSNSDATPVQIQETLFVTDRTDPVKELPKDQQTVPSELRNPDQKEEPQDFLVLREKLADSGTLFEDPEFPAIQSSISHTGKASTKYVWLRPKEICKNPEFFVEGYSRFDVRQGTIGDCWFLAALANLTQNEKYFKEVVPSDNSFDENYAGIFRFRFWQYGKWVDVVIDDRLPTYRGELVFLSSVDKNEFWSALLEKAYAKLHGSYETLWGGSASEAMSDFTGEFQ
jgi:calpain